MDFSRFWFGRRSARRHAAVAVLIAGGAVSYAVSPASGQAPAAPHEPVPNGTVDVGASRIYVLVGKSGLVGHVHAIEGRLISGQVALGAREQAGALVFDMRSFLADTAVARKVLGLEGDVDASTQQQTNANMLGSEVLDVARHPTARFDIRSAVPRAQARQGGPPAYELTGIFTLHGAQQPLALMAEVEDHGDTLRLRGGFAVKQTAFGMKPYAKFGGMVGVADELKIWGDISLAKGLQP